VSSFIFIILGLTLRGFSWYNYYRLEENEMDLARVRKQAADFYFDWLDRDIGAGDPYNHIGNQYMPTSGRINGLRKMFREKAEDADRLARFKANA
jgi:hypothetical protein